MAEQSLALTKTAQAQRELIRIRTVPGATQIHDLGGPEPREIVRAVTVPCHDSVADGLVKSNSKSVLAV